MRIPYTVERRADTGVNNPTMGIWLFLASEVMLFGGLFSAYAFLRVAALNWPHGREVLSIAVGGTNTVVLLAATLAVRRARRAPGWLWAGTLAALVFIGIKGLEWHGEIARGQVPAGSTFLATYFTLTGVHAAHVIAGAIANVWAATGERRVGPEMTATRIHALFLYWAFVDVVWIAIFVMMYVL
jgi:heme/copper-type cytochrome/quinol oxidase subunit 3